MRILVTSASKHGATSDIAQIIAGGLTDAGVDAVVAAPESVESIDEFDGIVIGSAVYMGHWLAPATELIQRHAAGLATKPVWLFSSGPLGNPARPDGDPADVAELVHLTRAREHRVFSGRIDRHALGLGERLVVAAMRAPDGDFRSPSEIGEWAAHIARSVREHVLVA